jgi:hypothetical protein
MNGTEKQAGRLKLGCQETDNMGRNVIFALRGDFVPRPCGVVQVDVVGA